MERAYVEYRRRKGLPSPGEIIALREKYGLGQRALAKLLGWSPATVYRYEKGQIPVPAHGETLKKLAFPSEMLALFGEERQQALSAGVSPGKREAGEPY